MDKRLGGKIRELREEKDMSLRELAKKLDGGSAAHLSDIELGRRLPSESLLRQLAEKLGVGYEELEVLDARAPIETLKRRAEQNPVFGYALRRMVENDIKPDELLKFIEGRESGDTKREGKK